MNATTTTVKVRKIPNCDICQTKDRGDIPAVMDGKTTLGPWWANLCENCFSEYGVGLGLGLGQRFVLAEPASNSLVQENATVTTGVSCGNCHSKHPSVADVRACYADTAVTAAGTLPATEKQIAFLVRLMEERTTGSTYDKKYAAELIVANGRKAVSTAIDNLLAKPVLPRVTDVKVRPAAVQPVLAGRYAVDGEDGVLRFYRVDRPTTGQWAGHTFVKVQASDDYHRVFATAARIILAKIAADPKGAMLRYGMELGNCGHCGRTLTDSKSRARGIGPVCASNLGW